MINHRLALTIALAMAATLHGTPAAAAEESPVRGGTLEANSPAPLAPAAPAIAPAPPSAAIAPGALVVDAMVGQVNGRPIYASEIFRSIGEETLVRVGQSEPRLVFKDRAAALIDAKLRERITNALILAEAERGLSEQEHLGLLGYLKQEREKIMAEFGGGVLAVTNQALLRQKGHDLDQEVEQRRQKLLVDKFMREKIWPKIHVDRREVDRYYLDRHGEFNPNPSVTLRVIRVTDAAAADEVDGMLKAGKPFKEVAEQFRGAVMGPFVLTKPFAEFSELRWTTLNEKARMLKEGQHSDRATIDDGFGWVMIEKLEGGEARTLQQAFLEIEQRIRGQKFNAQQRKYMGELLRSGNYTPVEQMAAALLDVAMARYARPQ